MLKKLTALSCCFLNACMMVGPDYKEPKLQVAKRWLQTGSNKNTATEKKPACTVDWWKIFHDPTLTALIHRGYHNNLTLQATGVRVLQTRAQLAQSVGELYPQQQALIGNYTYQRIGGTSLQDVLPPTFETAQLGFSASWELDFWGKYRRAIRSNDASFLASIAAYDSALVTLTADIANTYIRIRTYEALIKVTKANIELQSMSLKIARSRYNAGQTSLLDVQQAQTELSQTQATLPNQRSQLQRQKDRLGVLLGTIPTEVDKFIQTGSGIPKTTEQIEVDIPRETLGQRPDIHQARLEAIAQSEAIGAVKAELFPAFSLAGTFTFAANTIAGESLSDLFNWSNRYITAGPTLTWPLLNYGQLTNAVRIQDAAFQASLLRFLNLVLQAQQEVQDNITQYLEAKKSLADLHKASQSAVKTTRLALIRYKEGETIYTTVLDAERQQLQIQTSLTNAKGDVSQALVELYRALGGGWQLRNGHDFIPGPIKAQMASRTNWGNLLIQKNHEPPETKKEQFEQLYIPDW